jgi:hypothetical protein
MAKESLYSPQKAPIYKETFADEQTTRLLGGVPTSVTYTSGVGFFNGTSSGIVTPRKIQYPFSFRVVAKFNDVTTNQFVVGLDAKAYLGISLGKVLLGIGSSRKAATIQTNTLYDISCVVTDSSTFLLYVNGVEFSESSPTVFGVGDSGFFTEGARRESGALGVFLNGSIELFEVYNYLLTANEVANLYVNKRYEALQTETIPFGEQYGINPTTTGSFSTPKALTQTDTLEFIGKIDFTNYTGYAVGTVDNSTNARSFYVTYSGGSFGLIYGNNLAQNVTASTTTTAYNGWLKVTLEKSGANSLIKFYKSDQSTVTDYNLVTWTQIGTDRTGTYLAMSLNSSVFNILSGGTVSNASRANCYYAHIAETIGGTPISTFDPRNYRSGSTFVTNGDTWTINGTATIYQGRPEILNVDAKNGVIANKWNTTLTNTAVTPKRAGNIWAMEFNGSTSKLDCGSYNTLVGDKSFVSWIKAERISSSSLEYLFNNGSLLLAIDNGTWYVSNGILISSDGSFSAPSAYSASGAIKRMTPFHLAVTRTSTGVVNIYVNGVLTGSANQASGTPVAGSTNLTLGASSTSSNLLDGTMSAVRIIDGILTAQEISQLFSNERRNYGV